MAKIDDLIRIIRPILPSTTNNLQHLKRSRNIVGDGVGKYNDPLWSIGKTDKRPQNVNVLSQAEIDELNRANRARYQGLLDDQEAIEARNAIADTFENEPWLEPFQKPDRGYMKGNGGMGVFGD